MGTEMEVREGTLHTTDEASTELRYRTPSNWTIISSGPSAREVTKEKLLDGPVVAVNRAILLREKVPIDIWAVWDHPGKLFKLGYHRYTYPPLVVWLGARRFNEFFMAAIGKTEGWPEWYNLFDYRVGFRCMDMGILSDPVRRGYRAAFTLVYAVEEAVKQGAKKIRILGADMSGTWLKGKTEAECMMKEKWDRWAYERQKISEMIEKAKEIGVEVELQDGSSDLPPTS